MTRSSSALLCALCVLAFPGCSYHAATLTLAATAADARTSTEWDLRGAKPVEGEACRRYFLVPFPLPRVSDAVADALQGADSDVIVDLVVKQVYRPALFRDRICYRVEGKALPRKS